MGFLNLLMKAKCRKWKHVRVRTVVKPACVICQGEPCVDQKHEPYRRVTRSLTKLINSFKNFIIIEAYRCMPLLGDEHEKVPDWDVHIVRFSVVFIKDSSNEN